MNKTIPDKLKWFTSTISNGMVMGRPGILPVLSRRNLKKTGDSIARNNSVASSLWLNGDEASIREFLVFCVEGGQMCFAFKRGVELIWQWNRGEQELLELDDVFWDWLHASSLQEKE